MNASGDGVIRGETDLSISAESQKALMGTEAHPGISGDLGG